jgi:D-erythro-7,8-dihydroneopterin triphosphate epimerase
MKQNTTTATIRIEDLTLRTIIGFNEWERKKKQEIVINIAMESDIQRAIENDDIEHTLDYKAIKREIIDLVENSQYNLLETLTSQVLQRVMNYSDILRAVVKIDKPHALRFARSVSVEMSAERVQ